ncbi:MAG: response regulator [Bacteroidota bacterium]
MQLANKILLVDDDSMFNIINEKIIDMSPIALQVHSCHSANEALGYLKELITQDASSFPDTIFLDINMPEMDGWEFLEELEKFPSVALKYCRIYMHSSTIDESDIEKSKSFKMVVDFIPKPLQVLMLEQIFTSDNKIG